MRIPSGVPFYVQAGISRSIYLNDKHSNYINRDHDKIGSYIVFALFFEMNYNEMKKGVVA